MSCLLLLRNVATPIVTIIIGRNITILPANLPYIMASPEELVIVNEVRPIIRLVMA